MRPTVFITIDTEEDLWGEFRVRDNPVTNVSRLTALQTLFREFGAVPTYLVNWAVVSDDTACGVIHGLADEGDCEIGMHCHPWHTPPFAEPINARNSMLCNLSDELVEQKLTNLHERISRRIGHETTSFRAGRWGMGRNVAVALEKLNYKVDTSISPTIDWTMEGGPDFTSARHDTYRFVPSDLHEARADGTLLEVPPTIGFLQGNSPVRVAFRSGFSRGRLAKLRLLGVLDRLRVLNHRWLSPEQANSSDMIRLAKGFVSSGHRHLNMSFHSNSLVPGITPFVRDDSGLARFLRDIGGFLEYAAGEGWEFAPLSSAAGDTGG